MTKKVFVKDGGTINIVGIGSFTGEVPLDRYDFLIAKYPQLETQFTVVEVSPAKSTKEDAIKPSKEEAPAK